MQKNIPQWIIDSANELLSIEIELGHIKPEGRWANEDLEKLHKRMTDDSSKVNLEMRSEQLFATIAKGLQSEEFSEEETAEFINSHLTKDSKLKYCSPDEVANAL